MMYILASAVLRESARCTDREDTYVRMHTRLLFSLPVSPRAGPRALSPPWRARSCPAPACPSRPALPSQAARGTVAAHPQVGVFSHFVFNPNTKGGERAAHRVSKDGMLSGEGRTQLNRVLTKMKPKENRENRTTPQEGPHNKNSRAAGIMKDTTEEVQPRNS